jgi:benzodiazapine receptor
MLDMRVGATILGVGLVLVYAIGSGYWIDNSGWSRTLNRPSWQPPDFIFGLIWPYNFVILATSSIIVSKNLSRNLIALFLFFLTISVLSALLWSYFFYQPHNFNAASAALALAATATLPLVVITFQASRLVGALLIPYQVWLLIAMFLSISYGKNN